MFSALAAIGWREIFNQLVDQRRGLWLGFAFLNHDCDCDWASWDNWFLSVMHQMDDHGGPVVINGFLARPVEVKLIQFEQFSANAQEALVCRMVVCDFQVVDVFAG